jgi:hypothetical protein
MTDPVLGIIDSQADDRDLEFRFFKVFSRFEYALKRSGFVEEGKYCEASPAWNKYEDELKGRFATVQDEHFRNACAYFKKEPPKTQIVRQKSLDWQNTLLREGEFEEAYILRLVRAVRNNLFHGGKYPDPVGPIKDVARNDKLLEHAITILEQCLALSCKVNTFYTETS